MEQSYHRLSEEQIGFIRREVKECGITFSHLEEELIDHLCCMTEEYLTEGLSFEKAYQKVRKNVAFDSLKDIEIKTLLLINKKFQTMKTTLKISGIAGFVAILIASVLKIFHLRGAGPMLTLGFFSLAFAYLPVLALTLRKEKLLKRNMNLSVVGISAAFTILISLLFVIMHWPFADYVIYFSWILVFLFLIMFFNNIMRSEENRMLNLSMLLFFTTLFVLNITFKLSDLNNPRQSRYTLENNMEAEITLFGENTDMLYSSQVINDSINNKLSGIRTQTAEVISQAEHLRDELFASKKEQQNFNRRLAKSYRIAARQEDEAIKLQKTVSAYRSYLLEIPIIRTSLQKFIENSIQFGQYDFNNAPPVIYNNLNRLIRDIKTAEYMIVFTLTNENNLL